MISDLNEGANFSIIINKLNNFKLFLCFRAKLYQSDVQKIFTCSEFIEGSSTWLLISNKSSIPIAAAAAAKISEELSLKKKKHDNIIGNYFMKKTLR